MKVRRIILETDYALLKPWWERRGIEAPALALLPDFGVIAEDTGIPVACAFLYEDKGGKIGMVEWEATNPDCLSAMSAVRAINFVFQFFEQHCAEAGIPVLLSWVKEQAGDGRILLARKWVRCPGPRHELMAFKCAVKEAVCLP